MFSWQLVQFGRKLGLEPGTLPSACIVGSEMGISTVSLRGVAGPGAGPTRVYTKSAAEPILNPSPGSFQSCWRQKRAAFIRDQSSASALEKHFFAVMQGLLSNITFSGDAISTLSNHARPFSLGASSGSLLNHRKQGHYTKSFCSILLATTAKRCPRIKYTELLCPSSPFLAPARTTRASRRSPLWTRASALR